MLLFTSAIDADPVELCDECAKEFNSLWNGFKGWDWTLAKEIKNEKEETIDE